MNDFIAHSAKSPKSFGVQCASAEDGQSRGGLKQSFRRGDSELTFG
jgi:hypothetical protein